MIRQHYHGIDGERQFLMHAAHNIAQRVDMLDENSAPSVTEVDCEEECSTGYETAPILNHLGMLSRNTLRSFRATLAVSSSRTEFPPTRMLDAFESSEHM
jgi:hypothetical protein